MSPTTWQFGTAGSRREAGEQKLRRHRALAPPLEKNDPGCDRDVQGGDCSSHRNADQKIALLSNVFVEPVTFGAKNERCGSCIVDV
jgi:hypothetical protein